MTGAGGPNVGGSHMTEAGFGEYFSQGSKGTDAAVQLSVPTW